MSIFPAEFADLEPFAAWALPTADARYDKRLASTMDELQEFYDAALPRLQAACDHLDGHDLSALPEPEERLLWLYCALMTASFPVEAWRQPRVPDSGAAVIDSIVDLVP